MRKETSAWVRKAENDFRCANLFAGVKQPSAAHVCYWCQQSAEKYLQALLTEAGTPGPRIHDLVQLLALNLRHDPTLADLRRGFAFLTQFADEEGFPTDEGNTRQAKSALVHTEKVRNEIRIRLGLQP